nr:stress up-regulated Nod 19 [Tanacetum cinerariifolium]
MSFMVLCINTVVEYVSLYMERMDGLFAHLKPIYRKGNSARDEASYIVGMSTCYPRPDSSSTLNAPVQNHQESNIPIVLLGVALFGLAMSAAVIIAYQKRKQSENG